MRPAAATLMASGALVASIGLHVAGFTMMPSTEIQIEGGARMQMAMLGNSFADMTEGTISPVAPDSDAEIVEESEPAQTPPLPVSQPVNAVDPVQTPRPAVAALAVVENQSNPVVPLLTTTAASVPTLLLRAPVEATASPEIAAALAPVKPTETLKSEAPVEVQQATPDTRRPVTRPPKPTVSRPKPTTTPRRTKTVTAPRPKPQGGNQTTRRGQTDGSTAGQATRTGQGTRSSAAGNAAASNYPGLVMRKISRIRKERAGARGKATVGFKVSASGAAISVRIIRSSGSAKIDHIALRHIKRASPFPRPPKGARRSFSIVFISKG